MADNLELLLGPGEEAFDLNLLQVSLRAALVYLFSVLLVRFGNKRLMGRGSAFDLVVGIMLGSVLSRAITGQAPMLPTAAAGAVLILMHWLVGWLAFHADRMSPLIKGKPRNLIKDGKIDWIAMRKSHVGKRDLEEAMRMAGQMPDAVNVESAFVERNGSITVIPKRSQPDVLDVEVRDGVQIVRIEINR